ncbi:hybrid sensor histidine kinase/response regulator transcription factor [Maribacter flavus]|uniref:histidine kinase n=1 Tax=Maribacter flavus TaxID=1658664 RepID=A0A5B2TWR9_9FLAO|nr:two-component regulator propeller domain-containing protein [Maribacter flavus]KAA2218897.1 response regulator [Maribacter flavus]
MNRFVVCFIFLIGIQIGTSQDLFFQHYGLDEGLSQQTIRCITKTRDGFLWLGTQDGLNRFDGKNFKVYQHNENDPQSLSGNFINRLLESEDGTLWVATGGKGVCYYHPETDTFKKAPMEDGNYNTLALDTDGNVYTNSPQTGLTVLKKDRDFAPEHFSALDKIITSIAIKGKNILLGTKSGNILKGTTDNHNEWTIGNSTFPGSIEEIIPYQNEWLLGTSRGLYLYNEALDTTTFLNIAEHDATSNEVFFIESIFNTQNQLYLGTDNGFFMLEGLDKTTGRFASGNVYKGDLEDTNTITSNRVYDVLVHDELIYIGTNNLDIASQGLNVFKTINPDTKPALTNNYVFSIFKDADYLFIGTRKGLNCIDQNGVVYVISKESTQQQLAYDVIRGMAKDDHNNLWVATTKGVSVISLNNFNPQKPNITSFYFDENDLSSLSNDNTRSIYKDRLGTMWVCTYGGGLNRFTGDLSRNEITFERYGMLDGATSISSDFVYNIVQDQKNRYWISSENGLNLLTFKEGDYQNPVFKTYVANGKEGELKNNSVLNTFLDAEGTLWVATQSGINTYDELTDSFIHFGKAEGLGNDYVYNIMEDADGMLWMSTNNGLFRFDKKQSKFTHFTVKDGLQSSEFNLGAHFNDTKENVLYFGGINGFNSFSPRDVHLLDWQGDLSLTSLKIKDKEVNPITHPSVLDLGFSMAKRITLDHDSFPCYIQFTDFDYRPNKNTQYHYSFDDEDWNALGYSNELQLLQLPKGKHTLKIQGSSRDGFWQKDPLELEIVVIPPWYNSTLAYFVYALLLLGAGYLMYRFRLRQKMAFQEAKRLKELDDVKSRLITNITHEFRTPLTVILGYLNTLNSELGERAKMKIPLNAIEQNSKNLLKLVNEMLDLAKLETGNLKLDRTPINLATFTHYIVQSFSSLAQTNHIQLKYFKAEDSIVSTVDTEKMRQILFNLISNALKFSEQRSTVKVLVAKEEDWTTITIQDQGMGIPKEELPHIFNRFYRSTNTSATTSGTGIGLSLTKELIHLMEGTIEVDSIENIGTTFKVKLPLSNLSPTKEDYSSEEIQNTHSVQMAQDARTEREIGKVKNVHTVLVVEDNADISAYIASRLDSQYHLLFAYNGQEGLEMAKREIPDIILTDVMMPLMDGYEMTKLLQEDVVTDHIPIIMLTAKSMDEDVLDGLKSGADAYLAKPFNEAELKLRISNLIEKRNRLQSKYQNSILHTPKKSDAKSDKNLRFLNKAVELIHKNLDNADYDSEQLAKDMAMSDSQLYRKLKAITDRSTAIFIRHVRLENAKELLQNSDKTVAEVAFETGFNDPNWFSKAFREEFGQSPTQFRN